MNCPKCENEIRVNSSDEGTSSYEPVKKSQSYIRDGFIIPFCCSLCGTLRINYQPVRDVVYLWPYPAPEKTKSGILLPDDTDFVGGAYKDEIRPNLAVILGYGPGYFDIKKRKFVPSEGLEVGQVIHFNKKIIKAWTVNLKNESGDRYPVTLCGFQDVYGSEV